MQLGENSLLTYQLVLLGKIRLLADKIFDGRQICNLDGELFSFMKDRDCA